MKFWDTSAIVPVCVNEPRSSTVKAVLASDPAMAVWWAARTECVSAVARQTREGGMTVAGSRQARHILATLANTWTEILPTEAIREIAERLLAVHALRAADAFQLAAALQWCQREPRGMSLLSFDSRLREAADREGFSLLPESLDS